MTAKYPLGFLDHLNKELTKFIKSNPNRAPAYLVLGKEQMAEMNGLVSSAGWALFETKKTEIDGMFAGKKKKKYMEFFGMEIVPVGLEDYFEVA